MSNAKGMFTDLDFNLTFFRLFTEYRKQATAASHSLDRDANNDTGCFDTENLISFEKVFKQQVKEHQQQQQHRKNDLAHHPKYSTGFNRSHSPLPGTLDFRSRSSKRLIQDEAARKIQRAFRSYLGRKRYHQHQQQQHQSRYYTNEKITIQRHVNEIRSKGGRRLIGKEETTSVQIGNIGGDEYNFINIYKKRGGSGSVSGQQQQVTRTKSNRSVPPLYEEGFSEDVQQYTATNTTNNNTTARTSKKEVKLMPEVSQRSVIKVYVLFFLN